MKQAIVTKFLGPTNHRGSRVKATCQGGSVTLPWEHAWNPEKNHTNAARELAHRMGWGRGVGNETEIRLVGGSLPDGTGNAYIILDSEVQS